MEWDRMIVLRDPIAVGSVMRSHNFEQYSMSERYWELKQRTGLDFDATIQLMDFLPAFLDGHRHNKIRKAMARQLRRRKSYKKRRSHTACVFV
jgi:hypothetical protein